MSNLLAQKKLIGLLVLLAIFSPIGIDIYLPALPIMAEEFQVVTVQMQDTISWFLISLGVGQIIAGPMADRFGRRFVGLFGIILYALGALLAWMCDSLFVGEFDLLLAARLLQGMGASATAVCAFAAVRDSFAPNRCGEMISYLNGAICFVPALAPILGSWLTAHWGWQANFIFMAAYAIIAFGFIYFLFNETKPSNTDSKGALFSFSRYWPVLKHPVFIYHALTCMCVMAVILAYVTTAPVKLINNLGLSMNQFTYWFGFNAFLNIIAALTAPKLMEKFSSRKILNMGLMLLVFAGILILALNQINAAFAFMLPVFLSSFGFSWVLGSAAGKALAPFGDRAGTAAALLGLFQMSGAGVLVSLTQRMGLSESHLLGLHLLLLIPSLLLLWSSFGKSWHALECQG